MLNSTLKKFEIRFGDQLSLILIMMMKFDPKDRLSLDKLDHLLRVKLIKLINK